MEGHRFCIFFAFLCTYVYPVSFSCKSGEFSVFPSFLSLVSEEGGIMAAAFFSGSWWRRFLQLFLLVSRVVSGGFL